ncbi:hypothetical protein SY86_04050 [Erwinia tracheiphila]|uniref:Uncharacterized protein n=1 Tax=Erwinia tracheiphila TaxID=65700 RepID=A0A0M2K5Y8_9GAMM|nr:hypothetical protein SY86_04050 [Erwinia tracheiphila]
MLTGAPIAALEKKAHDDEASGEIETAHPGYPGSQDTFCAGDLKGCGPYLPADVRGYVPESGALQAVYE